MTETSLTRPSRPTMYRQGDVLITRIDCIPDLAEGVESADEDLVLQEGESTGHAHRIASPMARSARLYRTEADARYMRVTAGVELTHEEHDAVLIPPGDYRVTIHTEYRPGDLPRQVTD